MVFVPFSIIKILFFTFSKAIINFWCWIQNKKSILVIIIKSNYNKKITCRNSKFKFQILYECFLLIK